MCSNRTPEKNYHHLISDWNRAFSQGHNDSSLVLVSWTFAEGRMGYFLIIVDWKSVFYRRTSADYKITSWLDIPLVFITKAVWFFVWGDPFPSIAGRLPKSTMSKLWSTLAPQVCKDTNTYLPKVEPTGDLQMIIQCEGSVPRGLYVVYGNDHVNQTEILHFCHLFLELFICSNHRVPCIFAIKYGISQDSLYLVILIRFGFVVD